MATSSIFHNIILREPEEIEAFIRAAEASEVDPYRKPKGAPTYTVTSKEEIQKLLEKRYENRELKK